MYSFLTFYAYRINRIYFEIFSRNKIYMAEMFYFYNIPDDYLIQ